MIRIGQGCDFHRFIAQRPLILGGVHIPHTAGLEGHSDADVLLHAVTDAVLGALAAGDIGAWFPPNDPAYKNADSMQLLQNVMASDTGAGWTLGNLDATVICEAPKLRSHVDDMRRSIANAFGVDIHRVSVKATTSEGMGFTGRGEGIAALAVILLTDEQRDASSVDVA